MKKFIIFVLFAIALNTAAFANFIVTPGGEIAQGPETSQSQIDAILLSFGISSEVYKDEVGGSEYGSFADDYTTEYFNSSLDPKDALITWDGPDFINDPGFLLVKDGNHSPGWYLFDIGGWNGQETLQLDNFWPRSGAISHVTLYEDKEAVPEPATMILFGTGLAGFAGAALRKKKK